MKRATYFDEEAVQDPCSSTVGIVLESAGS